MEIWKDRFSRPRTPDQEGFWNDYLLVRERCVAKNVPPPTFQKFFEIANREIHLHTKSKIRFKLWLLKMKIKTLLLPFRKLRILGTKKPKLGTG